MNAEEVQAIVRGIGPAVKRAAAAAVEEAVAGIEDPSARGALGGMLRGLPDLLAATRAAAVRDSAERLAVEIGARMELQAQVEALRGEVAALRQKLETPT